MSRPTNTHRRSMKGEYIETDTGNKISRRSKIEGTPHIMLGGRVVVQADACLRGDLCRPATTTSAATSSSSDTTSTTKETSAGSRTSISVGRYTLISTGATLHPPHRVLRGGETAYYGLKIGEHVSIGPGAFVGAASVGSHVRIGAGAVLGNGCIVKDCVDVLPGAVLSPGMVVPSGAVVGGQPARILGDVPDSWGAGEGMREIIRGIK